MHFIICWRWLSPVLLVLGLSLMIFVKQAISFEITFDSDSTICREKYNGKYTNPQYCVYSYHKPNDMDCEHSDSVLWHRYELANCSLAHMSIEDAAAISGSISTILEESDRDIAIQRITIIIAKVLKTETAAALDYYLAFRPWWEILSEKHEATSIVIVLDRYHYKWESYLRYLGDRQYPPSESVCNASVLILGRNSCIHPGWGTVTREFANLNMKFPYEIFSVYHPEVVEDDRNAFATSSDCPMTLNKWNCAFIRMTNCSMPRVVEDCKSISCAFEESPNFWLGKVFNSASSVAVAVDTSTFGSESDHPLKRQGTTATSSTVQKSYNEFLSSNLQVFSFIPPHNRSLLTHYPRPYTRTDISVTEALFKYNFLLRPNAFYRSRMEKLIHGMRTSVSPPFEQGAPCVAVHVRRGDRTRYDLDVQEWCNNITHDFLRPNEPPRLCKRGFGDNNNALSPCPKWNEAADFGCLSLPFGAVTLSHVVERVPWVVGPDIKTILLFSEDPLWIQSEIKNLKKVAPQWQVLALPHIAHEIVEKVGGDADISSSIFSAEQRQKIAAHTRAGAGTRSGANLMASFKLAQQCSGFIGHFGSAISSMFYEAMCVRHAGAMGLCPPFLDLEEEYAWKKSLFPRRP